MGVLGYDPVFCQGVVYLLGRVTTCEDDKLMKLECSENNRTNQPHLLSGLVHALVRGKLHSRPDHSRDGVFMYREGVIWKTQEDIG